MKTRLLILITILTALTTDAKTLIAYYSYTNNVHSIVTELQKQIDADLLRIEPAEKGLDQCSQQLCHRECADFRHTRESRQRELISRYRPG